MKKFKSANGLKYHLRKSHNIEPVASKIKPPSVTRSEDVRKIIVYLLNLILISSLFASIRKTDSTDGYCICSFIECLKQIICGTEFENSIE